VVLAVRKLFYSVLLSSETAAIEADSLATAEDHLRTIEERFRQGLDSDLVVLRQKVEVANARPPLLQARNAHEMAGILLKDALGLDVDAPASFVGSLSPPQGGPEPYERLQTRAIESNPEYRAALERASESEALVRVAQGMRYPQISLYADGQFYAETDQFWPGPMQRDFSSMGGLRLRFPLFTGGDLQERVRQARIEAEKARTRCRQMERSVRMEVKRHWLTAQVAAERSRSQESVIAQARRALEAMENRYKDGHASQLELHDATLALLRARLLYAQALHDYGVEIAEIEHAAGSAAEEPPR
jgi:outer membrane protein TolC